MATIKDVAKLAGVSISTISRVLNAPDKVTKEKRERVLRAIEQLKYHPNALARGLIHKKTKTLGILIPDISNYYYAEMFRGMEDAAQEFGHNIIICNTDKDKQRMISALRSMKEKQIDGFVFTSEPVYPDYYDIFNQLGLPVVLASTQSLEYAIPSVKIDDELAGFDAGQYLIDCGHRRIAMISGPHLDPIAGMSRLQGFMRAMRTNGLDFDSARCVEYGDYRYDDGYTAMERLWSKNPELTAVFAASDEMALGAIYYLYRSGIRVPDEVSVLGLDNTRIASMSLPRLTTVAQPIYEIGYKAVRTLQEVLDGAGPSTLRTYLPHQIVVRDTVKKANGEIF